MPVSTSFDVALSFSVRIADSLSHHSGATRPLVGCAGLATCDRLAVLNPCCSRRTVAATPLVYKIPRIADRTAWNLYNPLSEVGLDNAPDGRKMQPRSPSICCFQWLAVFPHASMYAFCMSLTRSGNVAYIVLWMPLITLNGSETNAITLSNGRDGFSSPPKHAANTRGF